MLFRSAFVVGNTKQIFSITVTEQNIPIFSLIYGILFSLLIITERLRLLEGMHAYVLAKD